MPDYSHLVIGWLIAGGICSIIGAVIGMEKGQAATGFFYGLVLGPLGLLLIAVADDERITCPVCRAFIPRDARVCPKCHSSMAKLPPQTQAAPQQMAADVEPPRVIPVVPRVATTQPRVVEKATRAMAKVTQALGQVTQALGQVPQYFARKPQQVVRQVPKVITPAPPKKLPKLPKIIKKAPRFFLHNPGDEEARGPFDLAQIQALIECGIISGETQFCREGENEWNQNINV